MNRIDFNVLPEEMILLIADYCHVKTIRNLYVCDKYLERTFTKKYVLFYILDRIFKENQRYCNLLSSQLGKTLVANTLGNFYGINETEEIDLVAIDINHFPLS